MNNQVIIALENNNIEVNAHNDISTILTKTFQDMNITVYGTYENPLFKAKDIGELLGIEKIRKTLENLDNDCKVLLHAPGSGGIREQWFLTEHGLYEVLFISRKPFAKTFKVWVRNLIIEIRKTGEYSLIKHMEKENMLIREKTLLDSFDKKACLYIASVENGLLKFGISNDIKTRTTQNKRDFPSFTLLEIFECDQNRQLEQKLKDHTDICNRRVTKEFNGKNQTELIRTDDHLQQKDLCNIISSLRKALSVDKDITVMKHHEKMENAKIKQMELQIELEKQRIEMEKQKTIVELKKEEYKYLLELEKLNPKP